MARNLDRKAQEHTMSEALERKHAGAAWNAMMEEETKESIAEMLFDAWATAKILKARAEEAEMENMQLKATICEFDADGLKLLSRESVLEEKLEQAHDRGWNDALNEFRSYLAGARVKNPLIMMDEFRALMPSRSDCERKVM